MKKLYLNWKKIHFIFFFISLDSHPGFTRIRIWPKIPGSGSKILLRRAKNLAELQYISEILISHISTIVLLGTYLHRIVEKWKYHKLRTFCFRSNSQIGSSRSPQPTKTNELLKGLLTAKVLNTVSTSTSCIVSHFF